MSAQTNQRDLWREILATIESTIKDRTVRPEIALETAPAPARLATHTAAILADVDQDGHEVGSGRLVVLYEPEFQTNWDGHIRCVAFVRAELDEELVTDQLLLKVGWSWITEALEERGAEAVALSGTVSRNGSQSFGDLAERAPEGSVEIRVSWTVPDFNEVHNHILAWCDMLAKTCALQPLTDGVVSISRVGRS
ncbi:MAG: hypothetical protein RL441_764 [Actinomycetota bacterium]